MRNNESRAYSDRIPIETTDGLARPNKPRPPPTVPVSNWSAHKGRARRRGLNRGLWSAMQHPSQGCQLSDIRKNVNISSSLIIKIFVHTVHHYP